MLTMFFFQLEQGLLKNLLLLSIKIFIFVIYPQAYILYIYLAYEMTIGKVW